MQILHTHSTEMGKPLRKLLAANHNIACDVVRPARPIESATLEFTRPHVALYSYPRPSNGQRLWLIEAEFFGPPDAQWWNSWIVDAEPTDEQIVQIVGRDLQTGAEV